MCVISVTCVAGIYSYVCDKCNIRVAHTYVDKRDVRVTCVW